MCTRLSAAFTVYPQFFRIYLIYNYVLFHSNVIVLKRVKILFAHDTYILPFTELPSTGPTSRDSHAACVGHRTTKGHLKTAEYIS